MDGERERGYVDRLLVLTRQFRLYCVTASTFQTDGSHRMRFELSSATIYQNCSCVSAVVTSDSSICCFAAMFDKEELTSLHSA